MNYTEQMKELLKKIKQKFAVISDETTDDALEQVDDYNNAKIQRWLKFNFQRNWHPAQGGEESNANNYK